jgi:S-DNA-T family DNA segregation ATPase FtsK/SpoIIIE
VLTPVPGKNTVGFEIPNTERRVIRFGDLIQDPRFRSKKMMLPVALGVDTFGDPVVEDLAEMPHLLVAGTTGSGKTMFINTLIASLVCTNTAKRLRFVMVDPKMIELGAYSLLPHLACPVVTDIATEGADILVELVEEMESRYRRMGAVGAKNIRAFNEIIRSRRKTEFVRHEGRWEPLPYIVLLIDEFADLMLIIGKEAESAITRLAQKARSAGIHLVIATQRPSVRVVTGLIKANFTTRVAFRVLSGTDSRTILDQSGAETLLGKGDLIYQAAGGTQRLHAAFLEESEVSKMVGACA